MPELTPVVVVMYVGLVVAVITDLREAKIRNWTTFPMMVMGLAINASMGGWEGLTMSLYGLLVAFAIYFPLAKFGAFAPGDGKLMMGCGALMGTTFMIEATFASLILFLPVGFFLLLISGRLGSFKHAVLWTYRRYMLGHLDAEKPEAKLWPFGLMLIVGVLTASLTDWFDVIS